MGIKSVFQQWSGLDYIIIGFLGIQLIWVFIIPYCTRGSIKLGIKEIFSFSVLLLYFPLSLMIKSKYIDWEKVKSLVRHLTIGLAVLHLILYVGETLVEDATFTLNFFAIVNKITFGYSKRPLVLMPAYYIRVVYAASIFLLVPIYFMLNERTWKKSAWLYYAIAVGGILTTVAKSLFLGCLLGIVFYLLFIFKYYYSHLKNKLIIRCGRLIVLTLAFIVVFDTAVSDGYIMRRWNTMFFIKASEKQVSNGKETMEPITEEEKNQDVLEGTERSNYTRVEQTAKLIEHWKARPILGHGYGSSVPNYIRGSEDTPYSYEMFLPAMLMKLGIIGVSFWIILFVYLVRNIVILSEKYKERALSIGYLLIALVITTQFNPFLINSSGMAIVLFILLELKVMMSTNETCFIEDSMEV